MELNYLKKIEEQETEGIWFCYQDDFYVKVARFGNSKYQSELRKINKEELNQIANDDELSPEVMRSFQNKQRTIAAHYLLMDWKGLSDGGSDYPYTKDSALEMIQGESFYRKVIEFSQQYESFKVVQEGDEEKN